MHPVGCSPLVEQPYGVAEGVGVGAAVAAAEQGDLPAGQVAGLQPVEEPVPVVLRSPLPQVGGAEDQQVVFVGFVGRSVGHVVYVGIRDAEPVWRCPVRRPRSIRSCCRKKIPVIVSDVFLVLCKGTAFPQVGQYRDSGIFAAGPIPSLCDAPASRRADAGASEGAETPGRCFRNRTARRAASLRGTACRGAGYQTIGSLPAERR